WGWLNPSSETPNYRAQLQGEVPEAQRRQFLAALSAGAVPDGEFVELRSAPFAGELFVMALRADGSAVRLDASGRPAPLTQQQVQQAVASLAFEATEF